MPFTDKVKIRPADKGDLNEIRNFVDFWLSGRGKALKVVGAVNECFISPSQHEKYIRIHHTYLAMINTCIIGWAVVQNNGSMIHLLIAGTNRGQGIGRKMMKYIHPPTVRSKLDQATGNPAAFYEKMGYKKVATVKSYSRLDIDKIRPNRKPNIDIFVKANENGNQNSPTLCCKGNC